MKQDSTLALEKQITDWLKLFDAGSSLTGADISPSTRWGGEGNYTQHYTVTTTVTPALRWAAMSAILMFH